MTTPQSHPDHPPAHAFTGMDTTFADLSIDAYGSIIVAGAGTAQADCAFFVGRISPDGSSWTSRVTPFPFYLPPNPDPYTNAQALLAEIRPDGTILLAGVNSQNPYDGFDNATLGLVCYNAYDGLTQRLYAQHDANWNVTSIADVTGTVVERFEEDPYGGNPLVFTTDYQLSTDYYSWSYLHQGGRWDEVSGTYYFENRDEDPNGFWRTPDPTGYPDGASQYLPLRGNPIANTDPFGLFSWLGWLRPLCSAQHWKNLKDSTTPGRLVIYRDAVGQRIALLPDLATGLPSDWILDAGTGEYEIDAFAIEYPDGTIKFYKVSDTNTVHVSANGTYYKNGKPYLPGEISILGNAKDVTSAVGKPWPPPLPSRPRPVRDRPLPQP